MSDLIKSLRESILNLDAKKTPPRSSQQIHANHSCEIQEVNSGPHTARIFCCFCKKHVQWVKTYQYRYYQKNIVKPMVLKDLMTKLHYNAHEEWEPRYYQQAHEHIKDYYSNSGEDDSRDHSDYMNNYRGYE